MQMLPATAYVKMVDIWLIFGQLVPFSEVALLTAMEYIREGDGSGEYDPTATPVVTQLLEEKDQEDTANDTRVEDRKQMRQMYWLKVTGMWYLAQDNK